MIRDSGAAPRQFKHERIEADLVVVGGGLAGVCTSIAAAREGLKVILVQDRPVLGGNASSEVRLWILGATSHMGNNNRWSREGGIIDEILTENLHRNPEGNPVLVDTLLLDFVVSEPNIRLLLNTAVDEVTQEPDGRVRSVSAFCPQNSTRYTLSAPLFCDSSGDGVVGFLAGAAFRMGAEDASEFGEGMAPGPEYGGLLGHSLYFYTRDTGRPVQFHPPSFALQDITRIPRFRQFNTRDHGCKLWWIEHGGRLDTVHQTEEIKWELWRVIYGVWNHIKNSGLFPDAANLTLEWIGQIPGKRESRRFEGDYILTQRDLMERRVFDDAVSFGGWAIDLHPADGVYSTQNGCHQYHAKSVYSIPYRCLYSRNIPNLFLGGRIISTSHVAFGSTRVMGTCAHNGQAIGVAAALCRRDGVDPRALSEGARLRELQRNLLRRGQYIPGIPLVDEEDLVTRARVEASSSLALRELPTDGPLRVLDTPWAQLLPVPAGALPKVTLRLAADTDTTLKVEWRTGDRSGCFTPDVVLGETMLELAAGPERPVTVAIPASVTEDRYVFLTLAANPSVQVRQSEARITGLVTVRQAYNPAVAESARQEAPEGSGVDSFDFWCPERRPKGQNLALVLDPPLPPATPDAWRRGFARPVDSLNAWIADPADASPAVIAEWPEPVSVRRLVLMFDPDYDHPMESVLMGHPERRVPFCVTHYRVRDEQGTVLVEVTDNHQGRREHLLPAAVTTRKLTLEVGHPSDRTPAAVFALRCYAQ